MHLTQCYLAVQLKQLFGFCGSVLKCELVGSQQQLALVEYSTPAVRCSLFACLLLLKLFVALLASQPSMLTFFYGRCIALSLYAHELPRGFLLVD